VLSAAARYWRVRTIVLTVRTGSQSATSVLPTNRGSPILTVRTVNRREMSESTLNILTGRERFTAACCQRLARYTLPEQFVRVPHVKRHPSGTAADYRWANSVVQEAQS
jgi:hypothetical protein